ncbi:Rieske (2Fe-2S) protein [Streptomyces griseorubiginosus]|uniref:Rieske (2Fe-2S) protein n=1 Tax=Streptomyces griseorubiginosus TaxID=67304 RepID=UPI001AD6DBDD|nr:Rieske (2Fe-2S) protein [Streptomyces griseorubiginosus]MBO4259491.1 Rieske 2Fe-2S domain-containing protein [Streptomyces griseorubiginosus]
MTTSEPLQPVPAPARRTVVAAVGAAGLAVALTACGSSDDNSSSSSDTQAGANASNGGTAGGDASASASSGSGGGTALAKTADIPEGGGKIFKDKSVVVTQPASGTFKAFSTRCPHQGCAVSSISGGVIVCPCHGSEFSVTDGSVKKGPATTGLTAQNVTVSGDSITLA